MAEERLIDDDKDRKYKIRINENGEEELVIVDDEEKEEVPEYGVACDGDDELSKEEIDERNAKRREAALRKVEEFKAEAREKMQAGDFEGAKYALSQAAELTEYDGELYFLQLKAFSRDMTNFLDLEKCVDAAEGIKEYSTDEQKSELSSLSAPLQKRIAEFESSCQSLREENEQGKAERRETFAKGKSKALGLLACTAIPMVLFAVMAIVFSTLMEADISDAYMILTIVFAALAVAALFASIFTLNKFLTASRKVKLNEDDSSTKVGREYLSCKEELENLKKIYSSFENDIS